MLIFLCLVYTLPTILYFSFRLARWLQSKAEFKISLWLMTHMVGKFVLPYLTEICAASSLLILGK